MKSSVHTQRAERSIVLLLSLVFSLSSIIPTNTVAQQRVNHSLIVPAGTVLILETETRLDSKTTRSSDRFTARLSEPVTDATGNILIPADSTVSGYTKSVTAAQHRRRSGVIEVLFDGLQFPGGREYKINGILTSAETKERQRIDEEGTLTPGSGNHRHIVFIGAGVGSGAIIGVLTGSAILGAGVGAAAGVAAVFLAKGKEAVVPEGTRIGIELTQSLDLKTGKAGAPKLSPREPQPEIEPGIKDPPMVDDAKDEPQLPTTKPVRPHRVIRQPDPPMSVQTAVNQPAINPPLAAQPDQPEPEQPKPVAPKPVAPKPAPSKPAEPKMNEPKPATDGNSQTGQTSSAPDPATLARINDFQVQRGTDGSVGLILTAQTSTGGWRLRTTYATDRDLLEIWLIGDRPKGMAAQVISYPAITITVPDAAMVLRRIIIHGANGDFKDEIPLK